MTCTLYAACCGRGACAVGPLLFVEVNIVLLLAITANALLILAPYRSALRAANIELTMAELVMYYSK
eukprot:3222749-Amphidinium_carterae.1